MSNRLYTTQHTVPAGTAAAAPLVQAVVLEDCNLDELEIIIPDGHVYSTGIAIHSGGAPVVPFALGTFIQGNNDRINFPYAAEVGANQLQVVMFNTGVYAHTFYIRWQISDIGGPAPATIVSPQLSAVAAPADVASIFDLTGVVA